MIVTLKPYYVFIMTDIFVMKNISIRRSITFNLVKLTQIEKETTLLPPCGETIQAKCNKYTGYCPIPVCDVH